MLSLEQVRLLDERVQRVITRTSELQRENRELRERLEGYQERIQDLEGKIEQYSSNQAEIEQGVLNALQRLDEVEDAVVEGVQEDRVVHSDQDESPAEEVTADEPYTSDENIPADDGDADETELTETAQLNESDDESQNLYDSEESGPELDIF